MRSLLLLLLLALPLSALADRRLADSLYDAGRESYRQKFNYEAYALFARARDLYHANGDSIAELATLLEMVEVKRFGNEYPAAIDLCAQTYTLAEALHQPRVMAKAKINERRVYRTIGDYITLHRMTPVIDSLLRLADDPLLSFTNNIEQSDDAASLGAYDLAEALLHRCEPLLDSVPERSRADYYLTLQSKLRDVLVAQHRYPEAISLSQRYIEAWQDFRGRDDVAAYLPYINHADLLRATGDTTATYAALDSLSLHLPAPEAQPLLVFYAALSQGEARLFFGQYDEALRYFNQADTLMRTYLSDDPSYHTQVAGLRGNALSRLCRYDEAETVFRDYLNTITKLVGEDSPQYTRALFYLGNAEAWNGHVEEGCQHYEQSVRRQMRQVQEQLRFVPSAARETYWGEISQRIWTMTAFALGGQINSPGFLTTCYDALLFSKALLLESDRSMLAVLHDDASPEAARLYAEVMSLRARLAAPQRGEQTDSLLARLHEADMQLLAASTQYRDYTRFLTTTFDDIQRALRPHDVVVDYVDYTRRDGTRHYAAYIVSPERQAPVLVDLCSDRELEALLRGRSPESLHSLAMAPTTARILFRPLQPYIPKGSHVYYIPAGRIHQVALENLTTGCDGRILSDDYSFQRLTSAREVMRQQPLVDRQRPADRYEATLYGGLHYDLDPLQWAEETQRAAAYPPLLALRSGALRGDSVFHDLRGSLLETRAVHEILTKKGVSVDLYTESRGTEETFLSMDGRAPAILFISTHGFYLTPAAASDNDYMRQYSDAMSLSGLALAGANAAWTGRDVPPGALSGILTASTIARMNLRGLSLVMLSACQSGLGEITPDGVYGLQRAFKKAGAQTLIMALWEVSDAAAQTFGTAFFQALTRHGWDKRRAFDEARDAVRRQYPEPYYWAPFVMLD